MARDINTIRNIYPEQIEFLGKFDPNTKWHYRSYKHKLFVSLSEDRQYLVFTNAKGEQINAYSASMIIFYAGGVQKFIETKCKEVKITFEVWRDALLGCKPIPTSMPKKKRERIASKPIKVEY